ncbi:uncharacterized protein FOBCDRAFT_241520 [Fusarium oxysporum Fo47]|uniref:uncharacterized protein n=1 Tax=Fusarium oxysporum Fo47 TaxID=660027 RepID=UPI002869C80F|nr:uncharacterized protein FOBCDRAFT_241520 [Fusarium oxysporum Fo47]QKD56793.2 hypothetical protein FOBCDRAFT_241520 [Fusarium oxysporum Fo47]
MHIVILSGSQSKPFLSGMGNLWENISSASIPMVSVMPYQYPPLPPVDIETGMSPQGFMLCTVPSQQLSSLSMFDIRDPRSPNQGHDLSIKGAFSAPTGDPLHPGETDEQSQQMGTKKRSKLGYHRISVACGHCRRRKIRCITSSSDVQGRCINCIRLRKECSCFPVDQTSTYDSRAKKTSRSSTEVKGNSATTISNPVKQPRKLRPPFSPSTKNATSIAVPTAIEVTRTEGFPPEMRASYASPTNQKPFGIRNQDLSNWMLADADQSPTSNTGELNPTWQTYPSESPMSTQFSPFASVPLSSVGWTSGSSKPTSHGDVDLAWGPYAHPVRSMLYGGEPLASYHPSQYPLMASSRQFERRPSALSDVYITSMSGVIPGFEACTSSNMNPTVPLSAGAVTPANHPAWDQSQPLPGYTFTKNQDAYAGGWPSGRNGRVHPLQVAGPSQTQSAIQ